MTTTTTPNHKGNGTNTSWSSSATASPLGTSILLEGEDDHHLDEDHVQRMAQALGPQLSELESLLGEMSASAAAQNSSSYSYDENDDDEDDLSQEMMDLQQSEAMLREQLEFADDFGDLLRLTPSKEEADDDDRYTHADEEDEAPTAESPVRKIPLASYTLQDHADTLNLSAEAVGGWYHVDLSEHFLSCSYNVDYEFELVKEYCLPIPVRKLKRLFVGLVVVGNTSASTTNTNKTPSKSKRPPRPEAASAALRQALGSPIPEVKEEEEEVRLITTTPSNMQAVHSLDEPLSVRTLTIRLRPDILCGAAMDAVQHALVEEWASSSSSSPILTHVLKRQGGHLRAAAVLVTHPTIVAFLVDIQVVTAKNNNMDRRLLVRVYHVQEDSEAVAELGNLLVAYRAQQQQEETQQSSAEPTTDAPCAAHQQLKQACSLIQRMMAAEHAPSEQPVLLAHQAATYSTRKQMQDAIATHLESSFKPCPSVRDENKKVNPTIRRLTLPALSAKDSTILQASWPLMVAMFDELSSRECTYNTLSTLDFGRFPSLPGLDVHYCSQLRRLSREAMIADLLKSAKELEEYAKQAEYQCATLLAAVQPLLLYYKVPPIDPPRPKGLEEYPLDYTPPQVSCPPWGTKVMEALNQIQQQVANQLDDSMDEADRFLDADSAVQKVYQAFRRQDDQEQAARLGRKNAQVVDRLANMASHPAHVVQAMQEATVHSKAARAAAQDFLQAAQSATNVGQAGHPRLLQALVPLVECRIAMGASRSGTCYITATQVLIQTSYLPVMGGKKSVLLDLSLISDIQVHDNVSSTLFNPFPNTISLLVHDQVVTSFRPSISPQKFKSILTTVQGIAAAANAPTPPAAPLVVQEDGVLRLTNTNSSDDQLSI